ncbi:MAG: site-specific integrase [Halanaerobiales bacterium]|nr:site-specific integrase [Halanaerobiales bacterium]
MAHLRKKGKKKWQIVLNVGINPKTGRKKRKTKIVNANKTKAKKVMHKLAQKYENEDYNSNINMTLEKYLNKWYKEYCLDNLAPKTYNDYKGVIDKHLIPALGSLKLQNIKAHHIIKYQSDKLKNGRIRGEGGLSKRSVQKHHRILSKALTDAEVTYEFIDSNPCRNVKAPSPDQPEINPFSKDEMNKILDSINENYLYAIIYAARETGLRRGELLALKFKDVNFSEQEIYIQRSVEEIRGEGLNYKKPKNDSSYRNIYIKSKLIEILRKLKKHHLKISHADNLIFTYKDGSKIRPDYITKKFKKTLRKINLGEHRFHDLRHTHATELLKARVHPKIVQERLGHAKIETTLNIYSHVIPSMQKDTIKKLEKYQNKDHDANIPHIFINKKTSH